MRAFLVPNQVCIDHQILDFTRNLCLGAPSSLVSRRYRRWDIVSLVVDCLFLSGGLFQHCSTLVQDGEIRLPSDRDNAYIRCQQPNSFLARYNWNNLPANILLKCSGTNAKLNAVTAGQILQLLTQLTGTVCLILSTTSGPVAPVKRLCIPKK